MYLLFPSPRAAFTVGWCGPSGLLAHCQACDAGDLVYLLRWIGKVHRGGRGRLSSLFLPRSASGGALQHQKGVRPARGMDPQKHRVGCAVQASSLAGTGSLWDFGWGMGEGNGAGERLCFPPSYALSSGAQQLSLPFSSSPLTLRAELLTYNLPDVKSCLLSEHTPSGHSALASQTQGLCLASGLPLHPGSLPPVRVACTASPPFLPSSMDL